MQIPVISKAVKTQSKRFKNKSIILLVLMQRVPRTNVARVAALALKRMMSTRRARSRQLRTQRVQ
jgi:hypothetical protein